VVLVPQQPYRVLKILSSPQVASENGNGQMTDIVERLRSHASSFRGTEMYRDAADEIQRLRHDLINNSAALNVAHLAIAKAVATERAAIIAEIEKIKAETYTHNWEAHKILDEAILVIKSREPQ
jgi:hypothetical protein